MLTSVWLNIALIFGGILAVSGIALFVIRQSQELADHFGWSGTFVGLTILSIGTTIPETMIHIAGSARILIDPAKRDTISSLVVCGNVGADIYQQTFLLGLVAIFGTIQVRKTNMNREVGALILATSLLWALACDHLLTRLEGLIMMLTYLAYLMYLERTPLRGRAHARRHLPHVHVWGRGLGLVAGFAVMAAMADWVLTVATRLLADLEISASYFGVLVIGTAATLPELVTAAVTVFKHQREMTTSMLIGSNITNPLFGIGIGSVISTYAVPVAALNFDIPFKIATALVIYICLIKRERLSRAESLFLIASYFYYLWARGEFYPADTS